MTLGYAAAKGLADSSRWPVRCAVQRQRRGSQGTGAKRARVKGVRLRSAPAGLLAVAPHLNLACGGEHLAAESRGRLLAAACAQQQRALREAAAPFRVELEESRRPSFVSSREAAHNAAETHAYRSRLARSCAPAHAAGCERAAGSCSDGLIAHPSRCHKGRRCCGSGQCGSPCRSQSRSASRAPQKQASRGRTRLAADREKRRRDGSRLAFQHPKAGGGVVGGIQAVWLRGWDKRVSTHRSGPGICLLEAHREVCVGLLVLRVHACAGGVEQPAWGGAGKLITVFITRFQVCRAAPTSWLGWMRTSSPQPGGQPRAC